MIQDQDQLNPLNTFEEGPDESETVVGVWDYTCWKCRQTTPEIEWSWQSGEGQMWTEDDRIGQKLQQTFPFYRKDYARTADAYYYCNHCGSCGAVQADWFVTELVAQERATGYLPSNVVKLKTDLAHVRAIRA
jgi:hypothetical protein